MLNQSDKADAKNEITALDIKAVPEGMTLWSDEKRRDFAATFDQRNRAARYILLQTAKIILDTSLTRRYVGVKAARPHQRENESQFRALHDRNPGYNPHGSDSGYYRDQYGSRVHNEYLDTVGGRTTKELTEIAKERAEKMLSQLPILKDAVRVIDPKVARMLDRMDEIKKEGQPLLDELTSLSDAIDMDELPGTTTLDEFKTLVDTREDKRLDLVRKLDRLGDEGTKFETMVAKALYEGLPGLSDAILKLVREHREKEKALDQMGRRVTEHVLFGDSEAATTLLKKFEADELEIDGTAKTEFEAGMAALKAAAKTGRKLLKKGETR